jgi:sulfotransferase
MNKQFSFLSGLPRTGSTLLCSILSQNPSIHAEGLSHVCELMRQVYVGSANEKRDNWHENILAAERQSSIGNILRAIPDLYYYDVSKRFVLDKCRDWTNPSNTMMIKKYITDGPKIIVLVRPIEEIVGSFAQLRHKNNWPESDLYDSLLDDDGGGIVLNCLKSAVKAKKNNQGEFLFVQYDEIVFDTKKTLERLYDFCEWPKYEHQLDNIKRPFVQNDEFYNLNGLHEVRSAVEKQKYHIDLPKDILKKCRYLNSLLFED